MKLNHINDYIFPPLSPVEIVKDALQQRGQFVFEVSNESEVRGVVRLYLAPTHATYQFDNEHRLVGIYFLHDKLVPGWDYNKFLVRMAYDFDHENLQREIVKSLGGHQGKLGDNVNLDYESWHCELLVKDIDKVLSLTLSQ